MMGEVYGSPCHILNGQQDILDKLEFGELLDHPYLHLLFDKDTSAKKSIFVSLADV